MLFVALPPADLPTQAYIPPTGIHTTALLANTAIPEHTVRSGETVYGIAAHYRVSPEAIVRANGLSSGGQWILPGQKLTIPSTSASPAPSTTGSPSSSGSSHSDSSSSVRITVRSGDTLSQLALTHGVSVADLVSANSITNSRLIYPGQFLVLSASAKTSSTGSSSPGSGSSTSTGASTAQTSVTVNNGDTLYGIAARHGVSVAALARANDLSNPSLIYPGQRLELPGATSERESTAPSRGGASGSTGSASTAPGSAAAIPSSLSRPYDQHNIGDLFVGEDVPNTFLHYTYSNAVARAAAANRAYLATTQVPSQAEIRSMIETTARQFGVNPQLMVALSYQESGWNHGAVSTANAIGAMQVIPTSGEWASNLVGRQLNLLDPADNVTAGVAIMAALQRSTDNLDHAIGGYYQGLGSVRQYGLFPDTRNYVRNITHLMSTL